MGRAPIVVVGAGFGGLAAAIELALAGESVTLVERERVVGGKARLVELADRHVEVGPTVLTMRKVFDDLFERAGRHLDSAVRLNVSEVVARHAFSDGTILDLFPDVDRSCEAITRFAGAREATAYRAFAERTREIAETVREPFLESERPSLAGLVRRAGTMGLGSLARIDAHRTMWRALRSHFRDPRLVQLFARYATYVGSSPFEAPATFNLVAHVEREGVFHVEGGIVALAEALVALARDLGVDVHCGVHVQDVVVREGRVTGITVTTERGPETMAARAVIANCDVATIAGGALGQAAADAVPRVRADRRSLSAITWAIVGKVTGFPLLHHSVFFSRDYAAEFAALFGDRRVPEDPTVYVCAEDRREGIESKNDSGDDDERLFVIVNAPPMADVTPLTTQEIERCEQAMLARLARAGMTISPRAKTVMTPSFYEGQAPGTGGAIYGEAAHGSFAPLSRPSARTKLPGFFLAGGSIHPGPGVPMAALSGIQSARAALSTPELARSRSETGSIFRSRTADTAGSTSTE